MTVDDAKQVTQLRNEIGGSGHCDSCAVGHGGARMVQHHVCQLRQILDLQASVEQERARACVVPENSTG